MSEDEAINKATKFVQEYREKEQKFYDYLFSMKENDIPIQAIETILDNFKKYDAGKIISIKVLEKYYLVSKDKEKQMTYANKELFKQYVPKDEIREKMKIIENECETCPYNHIFCEERKPLVNSAKYCSKLECYDVLKSLLEE